MQLPSTHVQNEESNGEAERTFGGTETFAQCARMQDTGRAGTSVRILAALNCARIVLVKELDEDVRGIRLFRYAQEELAAEEIFSICGQWPSTTHHLDVDDIYNVPLFTKALSRVSSKYYRPELAEIRDALSELCSHCFKYQAVAMVVSRPPEIVTCLKIPLPTRHAFLVYNTNPAASQVNGVFTYYDSIEATATYLSNLLAIDKGLLSDPNLQWQARLLSRFSSHIFVANEFDTEDLKQTILESSIALLSLKEEVAQLRQSHDSSLDEIKHLQSELDRALHKESTYSDRIDFFESSSSRASGSAKRSGETYHQGEPTRITPRESRRQPSRPSSNLPQRRSKDLFNLNDDSVSQQSPAQRWPQISQLPSAGPSRSQGSSYNFDESAIPDFMVLDENPKTNSISRSVPRLGVAETNGRASPNWRKEQLASAELQSSTAGSSCSRSSEAKIPDFMKPDPPPFDSGRRAGGDNKRSENAKLAMRTAQRCGICFDEKPKHDLACLQPCQHELCKECTKGHISSKLAEHRYPIVCPICMVGSGKRSELGMVDDSLIREVEISEKERQLYEELQLAAFSILLHCRGCKRSAFVDRTEYEETAIICCPFVECNYLWCKSCQHPVPIDGPKHSCDGSSELDDLMSRQGWKYCPGCKTPVQKDAGCNHMNCMSPGCNTHFCYLCGDMILRSVVRSEIREAVTAHFNRCQLF